ncbi:MAG: myo-inosose-2 dehydratase [Oscillospiraceae bacterium]|nr:myo-inosose-2 dehydratase [Oscillospiraceae bacterium]
MFDPKKVKVGIAPIGWVNDDMPDLGAENTFEQILSEAALAGYVGTEVGNKYPKDPALLKTYLEPRGLEIANAWFSSFLITQPYEEVERAFIAHRDYLHALGAKIIGLSEQGHSIQGQMETAIFDCKYVMNDAEWGLLLTGLNKLGALAREKGMRLTVHHHMGTVVQTADEINRLMAGTDPDLVGLLYDVGHLAYCGEDPLAVLSKHIGRVLHVHLKDIRPDIVARVRAEKLSFLQGVRMGAFTVPGDGSVDFVPIFRALAEYGYAGWLLVEAEQDPAVANPFVYAVRARKYIREAAGV